MSSYRPRTCAISAATWASSGERPDRSESRRLTSEECAARARGDPETFPRKTPKKTGALRRGAAFVVTRGDELLVHTRPEKGLLGAMTEVPGSGWAHDFDPARALKAAPRFKLEPGDAVCMDNFRMMHGREPYTDPNRLLYRVWVWTTAGLPVPPSLAVSNPPASAFQGEDEKIQQALAGIRTGRR